MPLTRLKNTINKMVDFEANDITGGILTIFNFSMRLDHIVLLVINNTLSSNKQNKVGVVILMRR